MQFIDTAKRNGSMQNAECSPR